MSADRPRGDGPLWVASGGHGGRVVVLLHGIGATAAVWVKVARVLESRGLRWIAPDLRGHGGSTGQGPYGFGMHAADIAMLLRSEDPDRITVLGHSFGGVVGACLAGGLFGPPPARLAAFGVKFDWTPTEIAQAQAVAAKPPRAFATTSEARARHLKISGLSGLVREDAPETARGIRRGAEAAVLAMVPGVFGAVGPPIAPLFEALRCPLTLACGTEDAIADLAAHRRFDPDAAALEGMGHNAHIQNPVAVADLVSG
ncbi:alpha/beta fold hydrolase [Salipiger sp. IMCC34102]|uniref:alpha/beta fold hydrolase n=1 Tax=Salipiger sp. IMCC34102 TaxID=2510647 RepID=UPI0013EA98A2|nr:alpha/beta fold hydrolase [Salipiger sp. IMCC34102]